MTTTLLIVVGVVYAVAGIAQALGYRSFHRATDPHFEDRYYLWDYLIFALLWFPLWAWAVADVVVNTLKGGTGGGRTA